MREWWRHGASSTLTVLAVISILLPLTPDGPYAEPQGLDPGKLAAIWEYKRPGSEATFWKLDWSPDGSMVACCYFDTTCVVLNASDGGVRKVLAMGDGATRCDGYSPEGTLPMRACAFSPDGGILAVGGDTMEIALFDTTTWERTRTLRGHQGSVLCLDFSPDGRYLASGSGRDKVVPNNMGENKTFIWDLSLRYRIRQIGWCRPSLFAGLHNLFNAEAYTTADYKNPGRWAEAGLSVSF